VKIYRNIQEKAENAVFFIEIRVYSGDYEV
jgi:hypothetical protein